MMPIAVSTTPGVSSNCQQRYKLGLTIEDKILSGGSPLYGRRTATIDLPPLDLADAQQFYPGTGANELIQAWGVFGGTPYYLQALEPSQSLAENIQSQILSEHGVLHNEPEFLLWTEFGIREPQTYYTILRVIATVQQTRSPTSRARFECTRFVSLETAASQTRRAGYPGDCEPEATRKSRYRLNEPLSRFWFRYVYRQQGKLVQLGDDAYERLVEPTFTDYTGTMFERVCQNSLSTPIPKTYEGVGYWWHQQHELDVVGLATDGTLVAGECKYTAREMTESNLADLERTVSQVQWTPPNESDREERYCLFCRSGFSHSLQQVAANRDDVSLFTPGDIVPAGVTG